MRPYIVINGISSKTISGLLIQSLPPISKPKIRTSVEEIDGRDGDIVTVLGYSAYDKEIQIGLYGEYDVDDIIEYFNTSGNIVFSNEPDKYYKFALYEQIDLEKLLTFKQAKVKIHVQPFKYSDNETAINNDYADITSANITVRNDGNIYSKPTISVTGAGDISISLNSYQIFEIALGSDETTIIIDSESMNAYDTNGNYLNRLVTGDYDNLHFKTGINTLAVSGTISNVTIKNYSRWI